MTAVPKTKRITDHKLLRSFRGQPCKVCGKTEGTVGHHIKTVGAGGSDVVANIYILCAYHHRLIHDMGRTSFEQKFGLD